MKRKRRQNATGRSRGDVRHVRLYHWLLDSPAWKSLKPVERALYIELAQRFNGSNNGHIGLSVRDAGDALRISKNTAARAFMTLQKRGFVEVVRRGHFDRKQRHASEWRLTEHPCDVTGELATKAFMRWGREEKTGPSRGTVGPSSGTAASNTRQRPPENRGIGPYGGTS
jgi:hypothetical protein